MSEPSPPLEFIMQALASKPEERGCLFYSVLTFAIGLCVAELWPFGGTQADVFDRLRDRGCGGRQRRVTGEVVLSQYQLTPRRSPITPPSVPLLFP